VVDRDRLRALPTDAPERRRARRRPRAEPQERRADDRRPYRRRAVPAGRNVRARLLYRRGRRRARRAGLGRRVRLGRRVSQHVLGRSGRGARRRLPRAAPPRGRYRRPPQAPHAGLSGDRRLSGAELEASTAAASSDDGDARGLGPTRRPANRYPTRMETRPLRKVRSFVRRPGRITAAQRRALDTLLPRFGLPFEERRLDLDAVFGRAAPRVLDIGFGDGEALVTTAARYPHIDYLGVEIHEPGVGHLLILLERAGIENVRVIVHDVVEVIDAMLPDASFDAINLFFPDPWPKKRHHKRRLVQPPFIAQCERIMKPGALLHVATDWAPYAEH